MTRPVLFLVWPQGGDLDALGAAFRAARGVVHALAFTPVEVADQPFAGDGRGPALTVEAAFADASAFADALPLLPAEGARAQAMRGRWFATPEPGPPVCTLIVEYCGSCEDESAWLDHYDANHPPIMVRFPAVREVATFRPAPDLALPDRWARGRAMQRNKVAFDSPIALRAALASPVMADMRADAKAFPPYHGAVTHFPTATFDLLARG